MNKLDRIRIKLESQPRITSRLSSQGHPNYDKKIQTPLLRSLKNSKYGSTLASVNRQSFQTNNIEEIQRKIKIIENDYVQMDKFSNLLSIKSNTTTNSPTLHQKSNKQSYQTFKPVNPNQLSIQRKNKKRKDYSIVSDEISIENVEEKFEKQLPSVNMALANSNSRIVVPPQVEVVSEPKQDNLLPQKRDSPARRKIQQSSREVNKFQVFDIIKEKIEGSFDNPDSQRRLLIDKKRDSRPITERDGSLTDISIIQQKKDLRKDEEEVQRSLIQNVLKQRIEKFKQQKIQLSQSQKVSPRNAMMQQNELKQNLFPADLEQRQDFQDFLKNRYYEILRSEEKGPIQIIDLNKNERTKKDYDVIKKFFNQFDFTKDKDLGFYMDLINISTTMLIGPGDILRLNNLYFVISGKICMRDKKTRKAVEEFGPGSVICLESLLEQGDKFFRNTKLQQQIDQLINNIFSFFETCDNNTSLIKIRNADFLNVMDEDRKKKHLKIIKVLQQLPIFQGQTAAWFDMLMHNVTFRNCAKGEVIYNDGEIPDTFYIVKEGSLSVEKQIQVTYNNFWPQGHYQWNLLSRTQQVTKIVQTIQQGQYFAENEVLNRTPLHCKIVVQSPKTLMIGLTKDKIEQFFNKQRIKHWLQNQVMIKFVCDKDVLQQTLVDKKIKEMTQNAFFNSTGVNKLNETERASYLTYETRRGQQKLKNWFGSPNKSSNCKASSKRTVSEVKRIRKVYNLSLSDFQTAMKEKQCLYNKEMAEHILNKVFEENIIS